ncbi:MAG: integrase core domain-containing protein [Bacteroidales bacterium]|nr:integrase core domain-containing protein [Bacteroidales bacterium]
MVQYTELFNLNRNNHILFRTINEAREVTEEWRTFYNNQLPH